MSNYLLLEQINKLHSSRLMLMLANKFIAVVKNGAIKLVHMHNSVNKL